MICRLQLQLLKFKLHRILVRILVRILRIWRRRPATRAHNDSMTPAAPRAPNDPAQKGP